ncbi:MAG: alcohol dehydrogenase catalytic domain-containing protein, partial [Lachnospiraceae bacterium]|nr:alcohol dehydrogenase catalytic domain-containing protein [Lachnospiraceae bacterium]
MKALRFLEPRKLEVQEVAKPVPGPGDCLLKICACGICGSDPAGYTGRSGRRIPPMTMGHEFAAVVEETGAEVKNFKEGDRVIVQPINFCGECENCKRGLTMLCLNKIFYGVLTTDGAMAEYLCVPEKQLYRTPEGLSDYEAALAEPYAVTYGAYRKAGSLKDQIVLIVGAGTIGDCLLQLVLLDQPKMVIMADLSDRRLEIAKDLGATYGINTGKVDALEEIKKLTDGHMIDVSFEACGVEPTANLSIQALKIAGTT